jgi:hypothetical protein
MGCFEDKASQKELNGGLLEGWVSENELKKFRISQIIPP